MKDLGRMAQEAAEAHLERCWEAEELDLDSPAVAPFCGCLTCVVRETLAAAWPIFEAECDCE